MKYLAVIPARGGSKGIPRKNLKQVAGRPLIAWSIDAARMARTVNRVLVSTDDAEIADVARAEGAEVIRRPQELATDDAPTVAAIKHAVDQLALTHYHPDAVITLQPTSPLRRAEHIDQAATLFASDPNADSLVSCIAVPHIFHPRSVMRLGGGGYLEPFLSGTQPTRRQDKSTLYARNGAAIYITRTPKLADYVFGGNLMPFFMAPEDSIDIDSIEDLAVAEAALARRVRQ